MRMCKAHTFTGLRMHDIQDKLNCEGTSILENVLTDRIQIFGGKVEDAVLWTVNLSPTALRNGTGWGRKKGKGERV